MSQLIPIFAKHHTSCLLLRQFSLKSSTTTSIYQPHLLLNRKFWNRKDKEKDEDDEVPVVTPIIEPDNELTEEQIMKIRDKSRLPKYVRDRSKHENPELPKYLWQMKKNSIKHKYGWYGKACGLKPGIMWPSKDKLEYIKEYEKTFYPTFEELVAKMEAKRNEKAQAKKEREEEVMANLAKLPQMKEEFWQRYHKSFQEAEAEKQKKEKLIHDVREFLGYDVDPGDPRFQEALIKKDEEDKRLAKINKKQERAAFAMAKLAALADEAMEREKKEAEEEKKRKEGVKEQKKLKKADKEQNEKDSNEGPLISSDSKNDSQQDK